MNVKKITLLMLSAIMAFSFTGCSKKDSGEEQKKFDEFMKQEFVESMEQSYPNTHIILENPKDYGVDTSKTKVQIDKELNETTMKENKELNEKSAKAFKEFDRDTLSDEQKETYDIYSYMLDYTTEMNDSKFDYMSMPLESMTGMHTQLPTLFSDWTLRNEQDVKDVITLMKSVRPYMDSILAYTKKQEEKGTLMLDIKSVKEYCEKVVKEDVNSSVLTGLNESIDNLKLGDDKTKQYKAELKKAFQEYFLPAYSDIIKTMKELDSSKNNTLGLSHMKNGKEYYELLFKQATGTDKSIEDIKKELNSMSRSSLLAVQSVISKNKNLYDEYVCMRITVNGCMVDISIKRSCPVNLWNQAKENSKGKDRMSVELNHYLEITRSRIHQIYRELETSDKVITVDLVRKLFYGVDEDNKTLLQVFREHNEQSRKLIGKDFVSKTVQRYETTTRYLEEFIKKEYQLSDIALNNLEANFISKFDAFLKIEKGCAQNSAITRLKNLKKIIRIALENDWIKKDPFAYYRFKLEETDPEFLTMDEIKIILAKEFTIKRVEQVRDVFVFCIFTGLAFSDVKDLSPEHLVKDNKGELWIRKNRQKTKIMCNIPVLPVAASILEKYKNVAECTGKLLPVLSNQRMNSYLKEIADVCGVQKNLCTHSARHSNLLF